MVQSSCFRPMRRRQNFGTRMQRRVVLVLMSDLLTRRAHIVVLLNVQAHEVAWKDCVMMCGPSPPQLEHSYSILEPALVWN